MEDISISVYDGRYSMSNLIKFAESEMDLIGLTDADEYNGMMRQHILKMVEMFADEGHSGFSAPYAINILKKVLMFKPLSPLTGEDDEWTNIREYAPSPHYQNKRLSSVFKEANGECYNIDGKVFWEWYRDEDGNSTKVYYTSKDSRVPVTFPYMPPDEPIYEYRYSDAEPQQPKQNEKGFIDE
jgi:hypothetical protein